MIYKRKTKVKNKEGKTKTYTHDYFQCNIKKLRKLLMTNDIYVFKKFFIEQGIECDNEDKKND